MGFTRASDKVRLRSSLHNAPGDVYCASQTCIQQSQGPCVR